MKNACNEGRQCIPKRLVSTIMIVNALSKTIALITSISFTLERQIVVFIQVMEAVALISQSPLSPCVSGQSYLTRIFIRNYYCTIFLTENSLTHIDTCNPRCFGLSVLLYLLLSVQLHQRLTEYLSRFGLPFLFLAWRDGTNVSLLPSDLDYLTAHVTTIIIATPHSLPPLLHLLLSLAGVLLTCMT